MTTNLLNIHPQVFVTHESDVAWLLYQSRYGSPSRYRTHPWDSSLLMVRTLLRHEQVLKALTKEPTTDQIVDAFYRIQTGLLEGWRAERRSIRWRASMRWRFVKSALALRGTPRLRIAREAIKRGLDRGRGLKADLAWIGDKKHAQHVDPEVRAFLIRHFPEARYLHVVRHPRGVVGSTMKAAKTWFIKPPYFTGTAEQILEQWATQEEQVLRAKEREGEAIMTVRLEDLCAEPLSTMAEVFRFLDLEMTDEVADLVPLFVRRWDPNEKYESREIPELPSATRVMERYGYSWSDREASGVPEDRGPAGAYEALEPAAAQATLLGRAK